MKTELRWMLVACCCFIISGVSFGQEKEGDTQIRYYLNVSSEKDGVKEEVTKTYDSRLVMEKDAFFKDLGIVLPKVEHEKLVLETTIDHKKVSLSTMQFTSHRGKNVTWVNRDDHVEMAIIKDGKSVQTFKSSAPKSTKKVVLGVPSYQRDFDFDTDEIEGGNAMVYSKDRQVEVFAFDKDENGQIQMNEEEADKTIVRLEKLIEELKASKKQKE
ncbi:hypothetical protein FKX85_03920 [Echinicola soli]|uniref:GLPGLI family protein n=1 Tax=Echinicola soli TaxID=2591634 RepID=A0A514CEH8_9BACT|nr:hypothetical protein [Echinicola soli]QDH78232.1 hypothetical protein FKX85_03920 [Echinicola soli]